MHKQGFSFYRNPRCFKYSLKQYGEYLQNHLNKTSYSKKITIPEPTDKGVYGGGGKYKGIIVPGGRVGTPRTFKVDIKSGKIELVKTKLFKAD